MPRGKKTNVPSDFKQYADEQEAKIWRDYHEYVARKEKSN